MYICICICILYMYLYLYLFMYTYMYVDVNVYVYVYVHLYVYVYVHVYVFVFLDVYVTWRRCGLKAQYRSDRADLEPIELRPRQQCSALHNTRQCKNDVQPHSKANDHQLLSASVHPTHQPPRPLERKSSARLCPRLKVWEL